MSKFSVIKTLIDVNRNVYSVLVFKNNNKIYDIEFCMQNWPVLLEALQVQFEQKVCDIAICGLKALCLGALEETRNKK